MITPQFLPIPPIILQRELATQFYSRQETTLLNVFKLSFSKTNLYVQAKEELFFSQRITQSPIKLE
ncbi:unnamed protein product [Paramecium sonneborni]|uniref:Uncharacterized protein n=1 Tax=Paramecium sonneborni TaxID=65129 RepID=A0A8S1KYP8_9CILI|nr:unnamed protein product [Paramecium sonneborni]